MLTQRVIRLAYQKPYLRPYLLPLLKEAQFDPNQIGEIKPDGPLLRNEDEDYMEDEFSQQERHEIGEIQETGLIRNPHREQPMRYASLRKATIRLAHQNAKLRPYLLKILREG